MSHFVFIYSHCMFSANNGDLQDTLLVLIPRSHFHVSSQALSKLILYSLSSCEQGCPMEETLEQ